MRNRNIRRLAINGFGQIGKTFFRQACDHPNIDIVAINDLAAPEDIVYMLRYDSNYGKFIGRTEIKDGHLYVRGNKTRLFAERDPGKLPWKDMEIDIVVDASGVFDTVESLMPHIAAGARRVVLTAPAKDDMPMFTPNVKEEAARRGLITSNASCTTNALVPLVKVLHDAIGIKYAHANTIHAYTATQRLVDGVGGKKDPRRGRAAAMNISPAITGAASALAKLLPEFKGRFDGVSIRVPIPTGSMLDLEFFAARPTSVEEVNRVLKEASQRNEWLGILGTTEERLVSSDIVGDAHGSLVQLEMTNVVGERLVKVLSWYDNVWGYCSMLLRHVAVVAELL